MRRGFCFLLALCLAAFANFRSGRATEAGRAGPKPVFHPLSCQGFVGLDYISFFAAAGPNYKYDIRDMRRRYLAWMYLSGDFIAKYDKMKARALRPSRQAEDTLDLRHFYGDIVPLSYAAMCFEDLPTLNRVADEIRKLARVLELETQTNNRAPVHKSRVEAQLARVARFNIRVLLWENRLARARMSRNMDALKAVFEEVDMFARDHVDPETGRMYEKPKQDMSFADQYSANLFLSGYDRARLDILRANMLVELAGQQTNVDGLIQAARLYEDVADRFVSSSAYPNGFPRPPELSLELAMDGNIFVSGYYLRALVYENWLKAIYTGLHTYRHPDTHPEESSLHTIDEMHKFRIRKKATVADGNLRQPGAVKENRYINRWFGTLGLSYNLVLKQSRGFLRYEDSPFLWALHQHVHARIHLARLEAITREFMRENRKPPPRPPNSEHHCHAYDGISLARQVIPEQENWDRVKSWCTAHPHK